MAGSYPSMLAAGITNLGRFDQFDLYAGESDIVTSQAQAADGQAISQFQVLTFDNDGRLIPWGATLEHSTGSLVFGGQPSNNDTVTINGVVFTFKTAATAAADVQIGTDATATAQNLKALINGTPDGVDVNTRMPTYGVSPYPGTGVTASGTGTTLTLSAIQEGTGGNAITIAASGTYPSVSGATLTGAEADHASGTITFGAIAVNGQTVTINGNAITFETSGANGTTQSNIGANATDSAQNLKAVLNNNPGLYQVTATGTGATLAISAIPEGEAGNLITMAKSNTVPTLSGATLTGGAVAEADTWQRPIGIAMQPVAATTPGTWLPYATGGVFNHEALVWPDSVATLAQRKRAFAGTDINVGQLL